MKRTLTAVIALAAATGFAGLVQAQTTTNTTATPSATAPSTEATAPSATTAPTNPGAAPANPSMTPNAVPQASMQQPASGNSFWSRNISEDEVRQTQQQLQAQGLYKGPVDGKVGSEMQRALARYQQQNGLRQTGAQRIAMTVTRWPYRTRSVGIASAVSLSSTVTRSGTEASTLPCSSATRFSF